MLLTLLLSSDAAVAEPAADLVVLNANVLTISPSWESAEAFACLEGRFVEVGTREQVEAWIGRRTEVVDLAGKTVVPGFIDAHMHPGPLFEESAVHAELDLSPEKTRTMDDVVSRLRWKASLVPAGTWIVGRGYQDTKLGRHPSRDDLDRASTTHPIFIRHSSGHRAVVNSLALELAGGETVENPSGGEFSRDESGRLNGIVLERAMSSVREGGSKRPKPTELEEQAGLRRCFDRFVANGITMVVDAGTTPEKLRRYQAMERSGQLPLRVYALMRDPYLDALKSAGIQSGFGSDFVRLGGIKVFHGNSLSGRTCWLYEPYADRPNYYGMPPFRSQTAIDDLIWDIHHSGFQAAVHANGDREIDMVLDAFEKALERAPRGDHRHRIEHGSVVNEKILERMKRLGIVYVPHSYVYEHGDKMEAYGERRWDWMHANGDALAKGIPVAGNSDYPVSAAIPMLRVQSLVTRRSAEGKVYGARQCLTPMQALQTFTLGAAFACFSEEDLGSIEGGKIADFVVLDQDPLMVEATRLSEVSVLSTYVAGRLIYSDGLE